MSEPTIDANNTEFGYFDDQQKEYVITTPFTPTPWINYLGNDGFYGLISNTAGGYSFYQDPKFRRLTRYRYNSVPVDTSGRYFYLKCDDDIWSASGRPVQQQPEQYECRHGMGYSRFLVTHKGISSELTCFVPLGETAEVHSLTLKNTASVHRKISLFSYVEWCLWNAEDDGSNFQRNLSTGEVEVEDGVIYHKTEFRERRNHYAFYSVNQPVCGFDTDRERFLGPYRGVENPLCVEQGKATNSHAHGWSPIASHHLEVALAPGEERTFVFVLGYCEVAKNDKWQSPGIINKAPAKQMINRYKTQCDVQKALDALATYWDSLLGNFRLNSPDPKLNRSLNIWNQYQNMVTFNLSRSASFYESGIGRGMGFRDSNQDTIGFAHMVPDKVRQRILDLSATQKSDGSAYHQYQPLTKKGNANIGGNFNDDPMWMMLSTVNYIKETGDFTVLDEKVGFDGDESGGPDHFEHLRRAFEHVVNNLGPHGLPLIGRADWNDCLNLNCFSEDPNESYQTTQRGKSDVAESLMIAGQFVLYGQDFIELCMQLGKSDIAHVAQQRVDKMREAVLAHGWDGQWFLRAYNAKGEKIGSHENKEGKIFIESQGFCVMAGIGIKDGKARQALDSVEKHLATPHGIMLNQPAFSTYDKYLGEISSYPPGYKENAGIFCHNNPWIMVAEAMLGRGDKALEYFASISPAYLQHMQKLHKTEPYVYSQMIAGNDAATPGQAKNSWLTGTAAWCYYGATQYILGIKPDYAGLTITPCIPAHWPSFVVSRRFRKAHYCIEVLNPDGLGVGEVQLEIDGKAVTGNLIDYAQYSGEHHITATIVQS
ncbi:MAG: GH36-type glycosyl hydrolase domain-containing protein [Paraglaciecola chathamensis]